MPGLSADFKDRKPTKVKAKPPAPPANIKKRKLEVLKSFNLQVECFIDDAWHPATIKGGGPFGKFLPGYESPSFTTRTSTRRIVCTASTCAFRLESISGISQAAHASVVQVKTARSIGRKGG